MISDPNSTTILFKRDVPINYSIGIDFLFFHQPDSTSSTNRNLKGIKLISSGIHLLHLTNHLSNIRSGIFINCIHGSLITIGFNDNEESDYPLTIESILKSNGELIYGDYGDGYDVHAVYPYMINYSNFKDKNESWNELWMFLYPGAISTAKGTEQLVQLINETFLPSSTSTSSTSRLFTRIITTNDSSTLEINKLKEAISAISAKQNKKIQEVTENPQSSDSPQEIPFQELQLTLIDTTNKKASIRPTTDPKLITKDYLDKSWFIKTTYFSSSSSSTSLQQHTKIILEDIFSFILTIIFNNYCTNQQWITLNDWLFNCNDLVTELPDFYLKFFKILKVQMRILFELFEYDNTNTKTNTSATPDTKPSSTSTSTFTSSAPIPIALTKLRTPILYFTKTTSFLDYNVQFGFNSLINLINKNSDKVGFKISYDLNDDSDSDDDVDDGFFGGSASDDDEVLGIQEGLI